MHTSGHLAEAPHDQDACLASALEHEEEGRKGEGAGAGEECGEKEEKKRWAENPRFWSPGLTVFSAVLRATHFISESQVHPV